MAGVGETCSTELCLGLGSNSKSRTDSSSSLKEDRRQKSIILSFGFPLITTIYSKHTDKTTEENAVISSPPSTNRHSYSDSEDSIHRKKKLRLTKEQSTLLEQSFNLQTTLNPFQKHSLAHRLNLKPRQVEVWFQNRRARNKLKQDCEHLKRCCETLTNENRRLKKQLQELKSTYNIDM